jgi:hypothetical protein
MVLPNTLTLTIFDWGADDGDICVEVLGLSGADDEIGLT